MTNDLMERELGLVELLGATFATVRRNFATFGLIALLPFVPIFLQYHLMPAFSMDVNVLDHLGSLYGVLLLQCLVMPFVYGAVAGITEADVHGNELTAGEALRVGALRWLPLVITGIMYWLVTFVGMLLLLIPGIAALVYFGLCWPAVALRGYVGVDAMRASWELVKDRWWRAFGFYLLLSAIFWTTSLLLLPVTLFAPPTIASFVSSAVSAFWQVVMMTGITFFFLNHDYLQNGTHVSDVVA